MEQANIQAGDVLQTAGCHVPLPAYGAVKANPPHPAGLLVPETSGSHQDEWDKAASASPSKAVLVLNREEGSAVG